MVNGELRRAKVQGLRAKGKGTRAKGKGTRAKGEGQNMSFEGGTREISKPWCKDFPRSRF